MSGKVIQVTFSDSEYSHLENQANIEGVTVPLYIKNKVLDDTEFKKHFKELLTRVSRIKPNSDFNIKMVFATDWPNIEKGVRLALGRAFYNYVEAGKIANTIPTKKDSANVQWYVTGGVV